MSEVAVLLSDAVQTPPQPPPSLLPTLPIVDCQAVPCCVAPLQSSGFSCSSFVVMMPLSIIVVIIIDSSHAKHKSSLAKRKEKKRRNDRRSDLATTANRASSMMCDFRTANLVTKGND